MRQAKEKLFWVVGRRERISYEETRGVLAVVYMRPFQREYIDSWTSERTKPKPFSLSSSSTIVNRLRSTSPGLFFNCASRGSRILTWFFGSSLVSIVWFSARTVYPTTRGQ